MEITGILSISDILGILHVLEILAGFQILKGSDVKRVFSDDPPTPPTQEVHFQKS